jgi:hypothetical protein
MSVESSLDLSVVVALQTDEPDIDLTSTGCFQWELSGASVLLSEWHTHASSDRDTQMDEQFILLRGSRHFLRYRNACLAYVTRMSDFTQLEATIAECSGPLIGHRDAAAIFTAFQNVSSVLSEGHVIAMIDGSRQREAHLALALACALLERVLGDVYMAAIPPERRPVLAPGMRDVLTAPAVTQALGPDLVLLVLPGMFACLTRCCQVFALQCVLPLPHGLNLRNLCWHGMASMDELHASLCALAVVLFVNACRRLPRDVPKRAQARGTAPCGPPR